MYLATLAALALTGAAHTSGQPPEAPGADINCAAHYAYMAHLDAARQDAWEERGKAAVNAHAEAHAPAPGEEDRFAQALSVLISDRVEALTTPILALNADAQMDRGQRLAAMAAEFTNVWTDVRACDSRYSLTPLPSPFNWID